MPRIPDHIETDRLVVRRWTPEDAGPLTSLIVVNLEHLRPWMPWIAEEPEALAAKRARIQGWCDRWEAGGDCYYGVFRGDDAIGGGGLHRRIGPGALEIGYWIDCRHVQRGYATETAAGLTSAAFATQGIERVEIRHDAANVASAGVARRLGLVFLGEYERTPTAPAEAGVAWRWGMSESAWRDQDAWTAVTVD